VREPSAEAAVHLFEALTTPAADLRVLRLRLAAAARTSASVLSISDIAETMADALKNQQREILKHVNRMFQHAAMKSSTAHDDLFAICISASSSWNRKCGD
jgi:3-deoxy-D-arabino-heptulosonate 7-phosphate (DAHP) synthase class II